MVFTYNDTLLLNSIFHSDGSQGAAVRDIVSYFDYVDHSILNYEEFKSGIEKLISVGLVYEKDKKIYIEDFFKEWWDKKFGAKKQVYVYKEIELIIEYLNEQYKDSDLKRVGEILSLEEYKIGVNQYLKKES